MKILHGINSIDVSQDDYPTAESILSSSSLRAELSFPEGSVVQDVDGNTLSGAIPAGTSRVQIQRSAGSKNS